MSDSPYFISSAQNPKYKLWESLVTSKGRQKESLFILSGEKIINDFVAEDGPSRFEVKSILVPKNFSLSALDNLKRKGTLSSPNLYFTLDTLLFKELDMFGTRFPLLVCQKPDDATVEALEKPNGLELGLPLTDPANMGAICRTAMSFGVTKVILTPGACDPFHPKALRASSGATLKLNFSFLNKTEFPMTNDDFGLDLQGASVYDFSWPQNMRLWLGEEGQGLKTKLLDKNRVYIPINGMESLNATVAGSIAIYSYSQRFHKI